VTFPPKVSFPLLLMTVTVSVFVSLHQVCISTYSLAPTPKATAPSAPHPHIPPVLSPPRILGRQVSFHHSIHLRIPIQSFFPSTTTTSINPSNIRYPVPSLLHPAFPLPTCIRCRYPILLLHLPSYLSTYLPTLRLYLLPHLPYTLPTRHYLPYRTPGSPLPSTPT
jgi:hypothetical protein